MWNKKPSSQLSAFNAMEKHVTVFLFFSLSEMLGLYWESLTSMTIAVPESFCAPTVILY